MLTAEEMEPAGHVHVNAGRLWGGGVATAIVAALAVLAGVFITRGVLGIPVLAPRAASDFGDSSTAVYAGLAAGCALLATALLHVLLLGAPRPFTFFAWITGLADVVAAALSGRAGAARGHRPDADRPLPLPAPRHETGRLTGALYPAFIPGRAPAAAPVPARAGRGSRP
jgi:hypothetical protein